MSVLKFTKRTVILLEPEIHAALSERALRSGLSIGELIRRAIAEAQQKAESKP
jgi:predicted HicB family RNase H-like nuclease